MSATNVQFVLNFEWVKLLLSLSAYHKGVSMLRQYLLKERKDFPHVMSAINVQFVLNFEWVKLLLSHYLLIIRACPCYASIYLRKGRISPM